MNDKINIENSQNETFTTNSEIIEIVTVWKSLLKLMSKFATKMF